MPIDTFTAENLVADKAQNCVEVILAALVAFDFDVHASPLESERAVSAYGESFVASCRA